MLKRMSSVPDNSWLDPSRIEDVLADCRSADPGRVRDILTKAKALKGIGYEDVAVLASVTDPGLIEEMFATARTVKEAIYGHRIVLFAPLYVSNICGNECSYCAFRKSNETLVRHALTQDQIAKETQVLINQGHKRLLLVAGESNPGGLQYILDAIATVYSVKIKNGEIRRANVNIAPQDVETFRTIKAAGIGTYQCFQETYDRNVYA